MKHFKFSSTGLSSSLLILLCALSFQIHAQDAGSYMKVIGDAYEEINKDTWDYIRLVSKGRNAKRIEKRRIELLQTLKGASYEVKKLPAFEGDPTYRNAVSAYLKLSIHSLNNDYKHIVDMEDIAEQSYDLMEAYILTKEKVNRRMDSALTVLRKSQEEFAQTNNIRLVDNESRVGKKLKNTNAVLSYHNKIYLLFYKSYWYESQMLQAMNDRNLSQMEQFRQTLELTAAEARDSLKKIKAFANDRSLIEACDKLQHFFYGEAVRYMPDQIAFFLKEDEMKKMQSKMETTKKKDLTQQDVDNYNLAVKSYNEAIAGFNQTNDYLNTHRQSITENWNNATEKFYNEHL